jgi:hypothetical protein
LGSKRPDFLKHYAGKMFLCLTLTEKGGEHEWQPKKRPRRLRQQRRGCCATRRRPRRSGGLLHPP